MVTQQLPIYSPNWHEAASYGLKAKRLYQYLDAQEGVEPIAWGSSEEYGMLPGVSPVPRRENQIRLPVMGGIMMGYPIFAHKFGWMANTGLRQLITAWESTKLLPGWAESSNEYDIISVGSPWVKEIFENEGVTAPIVVNELGVDALYKYRARRDDRPFTFLAFSDRDERKGGERAIRAFCSAFYGRKDVRLILKSRKSPSPPLYVTNDNVSYIHEDYNAMELRELYYSCDCLIFLTSGEGFGLPPREFAATGGMVVATDFSGTHDYIENWGFPIGWKKKKAWQRHVDFHKYQLGYWAEPYIDQAIETLQSIRDTSLEVRNTLGLQQASWVRNHYTWERFGRGILKNHSTIWERDLVAEPT